MAPVWKAVSLAASLFILQTVTAHSWNEQLSLIDSQGKYAGGYGYPRGYVARTDPTFNGDSMDYLLPALSSGRTKIDSTDLLCHPAQRGQNQTSGYPRLQVAPGSHVAMKYLENGHVSLPQNQPGKPPMSGTVFVFGTSQPSSSEKIVNVMQWTSDGTGGDKRGRLLAAQNFDDGRCYQINGGSISTQRQAEFPDPVAGQPGSKSEQWCESDLPLPSDASVVKPGSVYTVYWVWQWPTAPGSPGIPYGKDEYYTTCSDLDVVANEPSGAVSHTLAQQDPQTAAVSSYMSRPVVTPTPNVAFFTAASWGTSSWATYVKPAAATTSSLTNPITTPVAAYPNVTASISTNALPTSPTLTTAATLINFDGQRLTVSPIPSSLTTLTVLQSSADVSNVAYTNTNTNTNTLANLSPTSQQMMTVTVKAQPTETQASQAGGQVYVITATMAVGDGLFIAEGGRKVVYSLPVVTVAPAATGPARVRRGLGAGGGWRE